MLNPLQPVSKAQVIGPSLDNPAVVRRGCQKPIQNPQQGLTAGSRTITTYGKHQPGSLNSTDHTFANAALIAQLARRAGAGRVALGASCINIKN
jgi:hypothetical protein